jgi:hypothetical protein
LENNPLIQRGGFSDGLRFIDCGAARGTGSLPTVRSEGKEELMNDARDAEESQASRRPVRHWPIFKPLAFDAGLVLSSLCGGFCGREDYDHFAVGEAAVTCPHCRAVMGKCLQADGPGAGSAGGGLAILRLSALMKRRRFTGDPLAVAACQHNRVCLPTRGFACSD